MTATSFYVPDITLTKQLIYVYPPGQATMAQSTPVVIASDQAGIPSQPAYIAPATWAGTAQDMRAYGVVTIVVTTAVSTTYTPQWSPDGTSWFAMSGVDLNYNTLTTIGTTFTGAISFKGGGYIRLNGGTGGVFQIAGGQ
jgi:hypothetical protein